MLINLISIKMEPLQNRRKISVRIRTEHPPNYTEIRWSSKIFALGTCLSILQIVSYDSAHSNRHISVRSHISHVRIALFVFRRLTTSWLRGITNTNFTHVSIRETSHILQLYRQKFNILMVGGLPDTNLDAKQHVLRCRVNARFTFSNTILVIVG